MLMHQKKSEVGQIGKDSCGGGGIFSGIYPSPPPLFPLSSTTTHQKNQSPSNFTIQIPTSSLSSIHYQSQNSSKPSHHHTDFLNEPIKPLPSTPHKRPIMTQNSSSPSSSLLSHSPTLSSLRQHQHHAVLNSESPSPPSSCSFSTLFLPLPLATKIVALKCFRHFRCARLLRVHYRVFLLISLPCLYFFTLNPRRFFVIEFLFALVFSTVVVVSINLALPRFPAIRLFLARSFPIKLCSSVSASKPRQPVYWSIGSKPKSEKKPNSGSWVHVYSNGDVYEGEFHKGKCSGSGVYYYCMSGRYEGDWIDEKYDGYGVETWARGSRYRGQYRQGLRHGFGVYRFYTGDVYSGEWSNGQSHGCGIHTCEDGSRYAGEFKWGVKHGLGHYHFRSSVFLQHRPSLELSSCS